MKVRIQKPKLEGNLTKTKLSKHLKDHFVASGVHPHVLKNLRASGFFDNLWNGVKKAVSTVSDVVKTVAPLVPKAVGAYKGYKKEGLKGLVKSLGGGKHKGKEGKKPRSPAQIAHANKMKIRGEKIRHLMKKEGITLGEASKRV